MADPASGAGSPVAKPLATPATAAGNNGVASSTATPQPAAAAASTAASSSIAAPRSSIAVGLHEAALDSPSFRASAVLFGEQVDGIERWLESYAKSTAKLVHDFSALEDTIHNYLSKIVPPPGAADGVIDADHTLLAMKRVSDGSRDWWAQVTHALRRFDVVNAEPIRNFLHGDVRAFKETRRSLEQAQKTYDTTLARYVAQSKAKEPSSLREDAFAVYETRRAYLKASMDFCQMAPQLRVSLDKLLTRVSAEFWREMKRTRDTAASSAKWGDEMDRIRGWAKEIELAEAPLKRELQMSRREIGETTLAAIKPSRELEDYNASTVPFLGSRGGALGGSNMRPGGQASAPASSAAVISEKQGWLFWRTVTGKPARVNWVHRWFYCRDGIFGFLVQGPQGVLQGDDIGVLLCSAKPAVQEDRRFCFEVKTKSHNLMLQAETQGQLTEWLEVFEVAKRKAFEASMARDNAMMPLGGIDPAFAITPPSVADFSARALDNAQLGTVDESSGGSGGGSGGGGGGGGNSNSGGGLPLSQSGSLPVPGGGPDGGLVGRSSFDVSTVPPRRSITMLGQELRREEGESSREHASRIMQRLDLHRKATFGSGSGDVPGGSNGSGPGSGTGGSSPSGANGGMSTTNLAQQPLGIASLISASHNLLPGYQINPLLNQQAALQPASQQRLPPNVQTALLEPRRGLLAPTTFTKPPLVTFLSKVAVNMSSERILCRPSHFGGLPSGILANYWGSQQWSNSFVSKGNGFTQELAEFDSVAAELAANSPGSPTVGTTPTSAGHRKTVSVDAAKMAGARGAADRSAPETFPANYPTELRTQHAQFRLLFPSVPLSEKLVLVFNAAWSSASETGTANQGLVGSGRIYVTPDNMYFYSQTMGLVVAYAVSLDIITEVTAAPGKDCDYIFLHLGQDMNETGFTRITIKTFLEDMYLLQARLNLLIDDLQSAEPMEVSDILVTLQNIVHEERGRKSPSIASWDQLSAASPIDEGGGGSGMLHSARQGTPRNYYGHNYGPGSIVHGSGGRRITSTGSRGLLGGHNGNFNGSRPFAKLPTHPIVFEPDDMQKKVAERHFEISAKACFHVLFGDKSFIFPKLYFDRRAREIEQGPWVLADHGKMKRQFLFKVEAVDMLGRKKNEDVADEQTIDIFSDHVTYVIKHVRTPWHLPHSTAFKQLTKIVITHVAKSKCKLAIYIKVDWSKAPAFSKSLVERQALDDASRDAEELAEVATDEVRKLGAHSRTKRAMQVYGNIGHQTKAVRFTPANNEDGASKRSTQIKPRTLTDMVLETFRSFMESVVTSLVMWAFAGCRSLYRVASAHRLLLAVLVLSVATNVVFSSRETAAWWTERHATTYMRKLGVGPNLVMSKSIYLVDLEAASAPAPALYGMGSNNNAAPGEEEKNNNSNSVCYNTFLSIANSTNLDAPYEDAGSLLSSPTSRATAQRLRRTRQKLGAYRHDLVVAMRVVNSVEREMVQSEWENWLADETQRCDQVRAMLGEGRRGERSEKQKKSDKSGERSEDKNPENEDQRMAMLAHWHEDYCGSCRNEQRALDALEWRRSMI